jgi:hypothetical protein
MRKDFEDQGKITEEKKELEEKAVTVAKKLSKNQVHQLEIEKKLYCPEPEKRKLESSSAKPESKLKRLVPRRKGRSATPVPSKKRKEKKEKEKEK